jgi:hypothetical protein
MHYLIRTALPHELDVWNMHRPSRVFWRRCRLFLQEFASAQVEVLSCRAHRAWSFSECDPGCCDNAILFELFGSVNSRRFLALQSWHVALTDANGFLRHSVQAVRTPSSHLLLALAYSGEPLSPRPRSLVDTNLSAPMPECEIYEFQGLPPEHKYALSDGRAEGLAANSVGEARNGQE